MQQIHTYTDKMHSYIIFGENYYLLIENRNLLNNRKFNNVRK